MIHYFVTKNHFYTVTPFLRQWSRKIPDLFRIVPYERIDAIKRLEDNLFIFSDLDRIDRETLLKAGQFCRRISENFGGHLILNHPDSFPGRLGLLELLWNEGINEFRAYPATDPDQISRFPVFLRRAQDHLGPLTPLLPCKDALRLALDRLGRKGVSSRELLAIEFCETADGDGTYRKYSCFRIGPAIIPGHIVFSGHWLAKENKAEPPRREEREYLERNPHRDRLMEIFRLANIDYGRIDYSLKGNRIQVWEINSNPVLLAPPEKLHPEMRDQKRGLADKLEEAFLAMHQERCPGEERSIQVREGISPSLRGVSTEINPLSWAMSFHTFRFFVRNHFDALVRSLQKI